MDWLIFSKHFYVRGIQVFFQEVEFQRKISDHNMVDDKAEAREISGRQAEGPTANLTESKNDENLW